MWHIMSINLPDHAVSDSNLGMKIMQGLAIGYAVASAVTITFFSSSSQTLGVCSPVFTPSSGSHFRCSTTIAHASLHKSVSLFDPSAVEGLHVLAHDVVLDLLLVLTLSGIVRTLLIAPGCNLVGSRNVFNALVSPSTIFMRSG